MSEETNHLTVLQAAEKQVNDLKKVVLWSKRQLIAIWVILVLMAGGASVTGYSLVQQHDITTRLSHVNVTQCLAGNEFRRETTFIWKHLIGVALNAHPTPKVAAFDRAFLKFIEKVDAPRNCMAVNVSSSMKTTGSAAFLVVPSPQLES